MVPTVPRWLPPPPLQPTVPDWAAGEESAEVQVMPTPLPTFSSLILLHFYRKQLGLYPHPHHEVCPDPDVDPHHCPNCVLWDIAFHVLRLGRLARLPRRHA